MVTLDMGRGFARALLVLRKQKQCLVGTTWRLGASRGEMGPAWASPSGPTDFHLGALEGIVEAFPLGPVDAIGIREVGAAQVEAVEVGEMAASEPEGSRGEGRTVLHEEVLVSVEGGELLATVVGQGVTWQEGERRELLRPGAEPWAGSQAVSDSS